MMTIKFEVSKKADVNGTDFKTLFTKEMSVDLENMTVEQWEEMAQREVDSYENGFEFLDVSDIVYYQKELEDETVLLATFELTNGEHFDSFGFKESEEN